LICRGRGRQKKRERTVSLEYTHDTQLSIEKIMVKKKDGRKKERNKNCNAKC
jgi:hypothetical protein